MAAPEPLPRRAPVPPRPADVAGRTGAPWEPASLTPPVPVPAEAEPRAPRVRAPPPPPPLAAIRLAAVENVDLERLDRAEWASWVTAADDEVPPADDGAWLWLWLGVLKPAAARSCVMRALDCSGVRPLPAEAEASTPRAGGGVRPAVARVARLSGAPARSKSASSAQPTTSSATPASSAWPRA
ncbi:hypothetical protein T492DRAFT_934707 [Pavlovales sp. CCMP2436]|nr:hypothetical protein T492DRAFT_934707 [Pavlovales sp. CCMP2436]